MKIVLSALTATAVLTGLVLNHHGATPPDAADAPIRVVAGRDPVVPTAHNAEAAKPPESATSYLPAPARADIPEPEKVPLNMVQTDDPFAAQTRNPQWASHIESLVAQQLPSNGSITCADFMCKAVVPLTTSDVGEATGPEDAVAMADRRAVLATKTWPIEIAYNRDTARIVDGPNGPLLTFLVTRNQWDADA